MSNRWVVSQSITIVAIIMLAVIFFPWDRVIPTRMEPSQVQQTDPPRWPELAPVKQEKKMPVYNIGPCECCGGEMDCCTSCPCPGTNLHIEVEGPFFAGNYVATWQETPGRPYTHAWVFELDGDTCGPIEVRCRIDGGVVVFDMRRPDPPVSGTDVTVICGTPSAITIEENSCIWFSAPGNNTLVTITFDCTYPEYWETITGFEPDFCDCSETIGAEAPINCGASSPTNNMTWQSGPFGDCEQTTFTFTVNYACSTKLLTALISGGSPIGFGSYSRPDTSLDDLNSGAPLTLNRTSFLYDEGCVIPETLTIQGHNPGNWCP